MPQPPPDDAHPFDALVQLMRTLRGPDGCPWDKEQTLDSLKAYAVEEVHELIDAIESRDVASHRDELGDVLLQIAFQSQIRWEEGAFDAYDVCRAITDKMVRRHQHVFGDEEADSAAGGRASWERAKAKERAERGEIRSALAGIPRSLPSLLRASRMGEKASALGFDWKRPEDVLAKLREEVDEIEEALHAGDRAAVAAEFGDLLLAMTSLARHLDVEPEDALRGANDRFSARFEYMEDALRREGRAMTEVPAEQLEALWQQAKER